MWSKVLALTLFVQHSERATPHFWELNIRRVSTNGCSSTSCRHGRTLFAEIWKLGYVGCYSGLAKFLSPWRQPKAETRRATSAFPDAPQLEATTLTVSRQLWS